jgi:hypothetical protein
MLKIKEYLDFYYFVTSVNVPSKRNKHKNLEKKTLRKEQDPEPYSLVIGTDPSIRIRIRIRIKNVTDPEH